MLSASRCAVWLEFAAPAANAVTFVVYAALGGVLFLVPTVLEVARGYNPIEAGTSLLPRP